MKRIFCISFLSLILLFVVSELSIWTYHNLELKKSNPNMEKWLPITSNPLGKNFEFKPEFFPNPQDGWGRAPEGLEHKKRPIALFGGSSTYGYNLNVEQTLSHKLAKETKRPIYNRAATAWGIQHMLEQSRFEELYNDVPNPEYVIYIFTEDQLGLLFLSNISSYDFLLKENNLKFKNTNGTLTKIEEKNKILAFLKSTYSAKTIKNWYIKKNIISNESKILAKLNYAQKHFADAKAEMETYWKDTKFVVFFFENTTSNQLLREKLEKNGFITISTNELTSENLKNEKYIWNNLPTEEAWNLLTPLIAEKLNLK